MVHAIEELDAATATNINAMRFFASGSYVDNFIFRFSYNPSKTNVLTNTNDLGDVPQ